jgi:hypothetical protein
MQAMMFRSRIRNVVSVENPGIKKARAFYIPGLIFTPTNQ